MTRTEALDLCAERDRLRRRLLDGDAWLTAHPDAPDYGRREDRWIEWLHDYCRVEDAIEASAAQPAFWGEL